MTDPPLLDSHVQPRERLLRLLDGYSPITVVQAGDGAGATTLVVQWFHRLRLTGVRVTWVDADTEGPAGVLGAVQTSARPEVPAPREEQLVRSAPALRTIDDRSVVVVHHAAALERGFLLELAELVRQSPRLRVVLCLVDAQTHATRLAAMVETEVITAADLAYDAAELSALLEEHGVSMGTADQAELLEWTAGHPGILTAALTRGAGGQDPAGWSKSRARRHIQFRLEQVIPPNGVPALRLLSHLTGASLDEEILDRVLGSDRDEALADVQLFGTVTEASGGIQVTLPPAVSEVLDERAASGSDLSRDVAPVVAWQLARGRYVEAARLALSVDQPDLVSSLLLAHWWDLLMLDPPLVEEALATLSADLAESGPVMVGLQQERLTRRLGFGYGPRRHPVSDEAIDRAIGVLARQDLLQALDAWTIRIISARLEGDMARADAACQRGLALVADYLVSGNRLWPEPLRRFVLQAGITAFIGGDLDAADRLCRQAHQSGMADSDLTSFRYAASLLTLLCSLRGDEAESAEWDERARELAPASGWLRAAHVRPLRISTAIGALEHLEVDDVVAALESPTERRASELWFLEEAIRAEVALFRGGRLEALQLLRAERAHRARTGRLGESALAAAEARLLMALGHGTEARSVIDGMPEGHLQRVLRGRLLVLAGEHEEAIAEVAPVAHAPHRDRILRIEAVITTSQALLRRHRPDDARRMAADVLRSRPSLRQLIVLDEEERGPSGLDLPASVRAALREAGLTSPYPASLEIVVPTARELELLELLREHRTRESMAAALFVSTNTVKTQLRALYAKLGARTREEALARAYELGLLG